MHITGVLNCMYLMISNLTFDEELSSSLRKQNNGSYTYTVSVVRNMHNTVEETFQFTRTLFK